MADNVHRAGFRWFKSRSGSAKPVVERIALASGFRPTLTISAGSVFYNLREGDVLTRLSTGYADIMSGAESDSPSTAQVLGVVAGFEALYDANSGKMTPRSFYPSAGITYSTVFERQSFVLYYPADQNYFVVDVDDKTTATTYAAYLAFKGENLRHIYNATGPDTDTMVDISGHATTNTFPWRIVDVLLHDPNNQDFSGSYVKLVVTGNIVQDQGVGAALGV